MFGTFAKILKQGFFLAQYHQSLIFLKGNMNNFFAAKNDSLSQTVFVQDLAKKFLQF